VGKRGVVRKESLLKPTLLVCVSLALAITIYFANFVLMPNIAWLRISQKDLLFVEGLLFLVLGIFFIISAESRKPTVGTKQWILYGAPSMGTKGELTFGVVFIALTLILAGAILIFLALR